MFSLFPFDCRMLLGLDFRCACPARFIGNRNGGVIVGVVGCH
jgi:hypothetical protein